MRAGASGDGTGVSGFDASQQRPDGRGSLVRAIRIATAAHTGQFDKAGLPYITHPLRVMGAVDGDDCKIVAVLHDVVEDSDVTLDDLKADGFAEHIIEAVDAITKGKGESLDESMARVVSVPLARTVKLADVADNMDPERLALLPTAVRRRLLTKYTRTRELVAAATSGDLSFFGES